jgi:membrane protein YdbS with pleckstrin-like domain
MKNLPKEKRERLILVGVVTIIVVIAIYYCLIKTQQNSAGAIAKTIAEQKLKVGSGERLIAACSDIKKNVELANQKLTSIEETMASGDMYAWVIQTVGKFGQERKVEVPQFSREVITDVGILPKFPYKAAVFNVRGTAYYHDLGKFLADFENSFPYARVQNIEMEPGGSSAANGAAEAEKLAFRLEIVALINSNTR